jgi:hypothetical protein
MRWASTRPATSHAIGRARFFMSIGFQNLMTVDPLDRTAVRWAWRQFWQGRSGAPRPARKLLKCSGIEVRGKTWGAEHGKTVSLCAITVDPPIRSQETPADRIGSLKGKPQDEGRQRICAPACASKGLALSPKPMSAQSEQSDDWDARATEVIAKRARCRWDSGGAMRSGKPDGFASPPR